MNSEIKIEKGIAIPKIYSGAHNKYPWKEMAIGDSFLAPGAKSRSIAVMACKAAKEYGRKFATRKVDGGVRVWRIA